MGNRINKVEALPVLPEEKKQMEFIDEIKQRVCMISETIFKQLTD